MATLLDGRIVRDQIILKLREAVSKLNFKPTLAIIQVGALEESNGYIKQKKIFAEKIGAEVHHLKFEEKVNQSELLAEINKLNADKAVQGIIIQLPIPKHLDQEVLTQAIEPKKDVDGLNPVSKFVPATAKGIMALLDYYGVAIAGKNALVIGRSRLVGKPTALALLKRNATVSIAHRQTKNVPALAQEADLMVVAIGSPRFIDAKYAHPGQVVVDVGINFEGVGLKEELGKRKLVGDVDFEQVEPIVGAISPVPGGVGAMTVASLFENLLEAATLSLQV